MNESSPLDLVLLQTFHEVAERGSITEAAVHLGRSQPAVSHRLRALEEDLGVPLFEKVGRRLRLTEYGRRLQRHCLDVMALSRGLRDRVCHEEGEVDGHVIIGTLPTLVSHLLVPVFHRLLAEHPKLQLSFVFEFLGSLREALRTGRADMLVVVGDMDTSGFSRERLAETELVAVMAPELAPRKRGFVRLAELRERRYLAWDGPRDTTFDRAARFVEAKQLGGAYTPRIPHIESLREMAAAGAGYALLPRYTVDKDVARKRLVALRVSGLSSTIDISLLLRDGQLLTPALRSVVDELRGL